ncbi:hypothetical protein A3Q56_00662 [Intoshia linei]|uniref:Uncharacterized protein n=1 Tax=Intoshia linei TaxID=1819745 RepID=A0A177BDE2_9BILA|nr:hypothetical protein A3Q56_00662 [Intoshia linei]
MGFVSILFLLILSKLYGECMNGSLPQHYKLDFSTFQDTIIPEISLYVETQDNDVLDKHIKSMQNLKEALFIYKKYNVVFIHTGKAYMPVSSSQIKSIKSGQFKTRGDVCIIFCDFCNGSELTMINSKPVWIVHNGILSSKTFFQYLGLMLGLETRIHQNGEIKADAFIYDSIGTTLILSKFSIKVLNEIKKKKREFRLVSDVNINYSVFTLVNAKLTSLGGQEKFSPCPEITIDDCILGTYTTKNNFCRIKFLLDSDCFEKDR